MQVWTGDTPAQEQCQTGRSAIFPATKTHADPRRPPCASCMAI
ncbi:hypothetical protein LC55x_0958 [Lysobacter capsici]|nr:hypothetical protein LC55x_0958 [Lysobacter capsici]